MGSRIVFASFAIAIAIGCNWGLPGPDTWATDSLSPRTCGLGAIVETYWPGHWHHYPPLHLAILTLASLPCIALAAHRVGLSVAALGPELLKPSYMTTIEIFSRAITAGMALSILANTMRLWQRLGGPRVGIAAGAVVAANAVLVYYAHTGNLDVPYLFWTTWGLVELDRVARGEPRQRQVLLLAVASVLTKDQAAAVWLLPLPVYAGVLPELAASSSAAKDAARRRLFGASALGVAVYTLVSGAATNPFGFANRVRIEVLGAGASWAAYPRTLAGRWALAHDIVVKTTHFTSWPIAVAAIAGLAIALARTHGLERARVAMPMVAAVSFTVFFDLGARRSEERFLLPQSILFFPYAAFAFDRALSLWPRTRALTLAVAGASLAIAVLGVASIDATLLADPRYEAERWLAALPAGTHVEVYGSAVFMPRIPAHLVAVRPGVEPLSERQPISGIADILDPAMDPRPRAPDVIVLASEFSRVSATEPHGPPPLGVTDYIDDRSTALFRGLYDGSLGYERLPPVTCSLPFSLECREVQGSSLAGEIWIYRRSLPSPR